MPSKKLSSSSAARRNWSTNIHWFSGNPKVPQTFSPKNLYLFNLSYSVFVELKIIAPSDKLPVNEALKILLSTNELEPKVPVNILEF